MGSKLLNPKLSDHVAVIPTDHIGDIIAEESHHVHTT